MADIEIAPLNDRLSDEEIVELRRALDRLGAPKLPPADESIIPVVGGLDAAIMSELLDRLEAHDLACDIYLPLEFDGSVTLGELRVGSAVGLLDILEELREELDEDAGDDEGTEEDAAEENAPGIGFIEKELRVLFRSLHAAAETAVARGLTLHFRT